MNEEGQQSTEELRQATRQLRQSTPKHIMKQPITKLGGRIGLVGNYLLRLRLDLYRLQDQVLSSESAGNYCEELANSGKTVDSSVMWETFDDNTLKVAEGCVGVDGVTRKR